MSLAQLAIEKVFEYEGKEYKLVPPNLKTCGFFEAYLNRCAIDAVEAFFGKRDSFAQMMDATLRRIQAKWYEWRNQGWAECLNSPKHFRELVMLTLQQTHQREVQKDFVDRLFEDETTFVDSGKRDEGGEPIMIRLWDKVVLDMWEIINRPTFAPPAKQPAAAGESASA